MAKIIGLTNQKGGVGKTSSAILLAFHLIELGYRVLCLDSDGQGNLTSRLARDMEGKMLPLTGTRVLDLFKPDLEAIEVMHCPRGMDLIPTKPYDLAMYELEAIPLRQATLPAMHCKELFRQYDYVIIDCPPSLGRLLIAALTMCSHVVVPVRVSGFSVDGIGGLLQTITTVRGTTNPGLNLVGVFVNDYNPDSREQNKSLAQLREMAGDNLMCNLIRNRPPIDTAVNKGIPLSELGYAHVAVKEVRALMNEIIEKVEA